MKINYQKNFGFYIYTYYQAKEVISLFKNLDNTPYMVIKYYLISRLGVPWIHEVKKLLLQDFSNKKLKFIIDCKKNPALAINCIRYGFYYIKFSGNNILKKKINDIGLQHNVVINSKVKLIDLKNIKNCSKYLNRIILQEKI